jgi:hypothetical protein
MRTPRILLVGLLVVLGGVSVSGVPQAAAKKLPPKKVVPKKQKATTTVQASTSTVPPATSTTIPPLPFLDDFAKGIPWSEATTYSTSISPGTVKSIPVLVVSLATANQTDPAGRTARARAPMPNPLTDVRVKARMQMVARGKSGVSCRESGLVSATTAYEGVASNTTWYINEITNGVRSTLAYGDQRSPNEPKLGTAEIAAAIAKGTKLDDILGFFRDISLECVGAPGQPGNVRLFLDGVMVNDVAIGSMKPAGSAGVVVWAGLDSGSVTVASFAAFSAETPGK